MKLPLKCDCCRLSLDMFPLAPVLRNKVWAAICDDPKDVLCWPCEEARAHACLGRGLRFSDLKPSPANMGFYNHYTDYYRRNAKGRLPKWWQKLFAIRATAEDVQDCDWTGWCTDEHGNHMPTNY